LPKLGLGAPKAERDAYIRKKVDRAIEKIHAETPLLAQQCEYISTTGRLPPDVVATATAETLDAIGSMHCAVMSLKSQIEETERKLKYYPVSYHGVLQLIRDALVIEEAHLVGGRSVAHKWQLDLALIAARAPATDVDAKTLCFNLPLAATDPTLGSASPPNELTVQRLLGFYVLTDKHALAAVVLDVYNHRRSEATAGLVMAIFEDIERYNAALNTVITDPTERDARRQLERLAENVPRRHGDAHEGLDVRAPTASVRGSSCRAADYGTCVEFAVHKQMEAAGGSINLYNLVCEIVSSVKMRGTAAPFVVPGGVKKLARIVYVAPPLL
jgi:hypothetical protein